jgi:hypothetical protein
MELTGKTLKDFWIWYLLPEQRKAYKTSSLRGVDNVAKIRFLAMSFTERYGVYVDFFDSVFIYIHIHIKEYGFDIDEVIHECEVFLNSNKVAENLTRPEARTAAIEKANEIYNLNQ